MGDFRGGNRGGGFKGPQRDGGRPNFSKKNFGDRDNRDQQMHQTTCSECGKRCEVPFRPNGDKPVFCNDCFASKRDGDNDRGERRGFNAREPRNNFNDRFNDKGPRETPKPHFDGPRHTGNDDIKKQLEMLNTKLDRLIQAMGSTQEVKKESTTLTEVIKKVEKPKAVKKPAVKVIAKIPAKAPAVKKAAATKKAAPAKKKK